MNPKRLEAKLAAGEFTLEDFRDQLQQIIRPGMGAMAQILNDRDAEGEMARMLGIIDSMTLQERRSAKAIDRSRRDRIARGAGVTAQEVSQLLRQFDMMDPIMKTVVSRPSGTRFGPG